MFTIFDFRFLIFDWIRRKTFTDFKVRCGASVLIQSKIANQKSKIHNGEIMSWQIGTGVDQQAPDFRLKDGEEREWRLSEQRGQVVVLLFYPGDETPVCTRQLCSVRDRWTDYVATGAQVIGISTDTMESHRKFAENRDLPLRLLSDADGTVSKLYKVRSWLPGRSARAVIVIDAHGVIRYRKVEPLSLFRPKDDAIIAAIHAAQYDNLAARTKSA
jgi:thioredoxin-dependent peroxiredoxin